MANGHLTSTRLQRVFQARLQGLIFMVIALLISLMMAGALVGEDSIFGGLKIALALLIGGLTLLWFLTTERISLALLLLIAYLGICEGYFKLMSSGTLFFVAYAVRNILVAALILNLLIKAYNRKLDEIGYGFTWPPFSLIIGFYFLWCIISIFHPEGINLVNSIAGVRPHIEFVPLYFIGFLVCKKEPQWFVQLLIVLVIIGVLNSVAAIHQYRIGPEALPQVWGAGYEKLVAGINNNEFQMQTMRDELMLTSRIYYDSEYNLRLRPPGLGSDHTFPAMVAQISIFATLVLLFYYLKTRNYWLFGFLAVADLLLFMGIVVSASRSYLLLTITGLAVGLLLYTREVLSGQKLKIIVLLIIAATILAGNYVVRSYLSESVYDRFHNISTPEKLFTSLESEKFANLKHTQRYLLEHPLGRGLGKVGPGAAFFATPIDDVTGLGNGETEVNVFLSELGIVGLFLFNIILIGTFLKSSVIIRNSSPDSYQRLSSMIVFLYLLVYLLNALWGTGATFPQKACIWLFMGCFWALHDRPEKFYLPTKYRQW